MRASEATLTLLGGFSDAREVTWVTAEELGKDRAWLPPGETDVERTLRMLFETVDVAARYFGADRVRLVFTFV